MDRLDTYRTAIKSILEEYQTYKPSYGDVEMELVVDLIHDHYQLLSIGWDKYQRIHGTVLHVDIRNGKIWIQHDGTEEGIANRLVSMGVPREDIILAFHPPYKWKYTDFGVP